MNTRTTEQKEQALKSAQERNRKYKKAEIPSAYGMRNRAILVKTPKGEKLIKYKNAEKEGLLKYEWKWNN